MMKVTISHIQAAPDATWDELWQQCPYATYFHSREWAEVWQVYTRGQMRPAARLLTFDDGLQALLPLSRRAVHRALAMTYSSSPAGTFGGWLSRDALTPAHSAALVDYLLHQVGSLRWRTNPYADHLDLNGLAHTARADSTETLDLRDGFDSAYKRWSKGHRAAPRQAIREGVTIRPAASLDDWRGYYEIYLDSLARWNEERSSAYRWPLFEAFYQRQSPHIRLWLACYAGQIVAGALCFYSPQHVAYWHGAALSDFFHLRPVNLLLYEAIRDACERGQHWFDFNPSGDLDSVRQFKRSFGTAERPSLVIDRRTPWMQSLDYVQAMLGRVRSS